jgi:Ca2+-transporting ATPase
MYEFLGLIGFIDPVREKVPDAIRECYTAGIRVSMITGDYAGTARTIAERIGLKNRERVISGKELEEMSEEILAEAIGDVSIFSRVIPEQKLKIIQALKKTGEIVAMTGDGVNDAPALKAAHIGIAMGQRGTDVAREASAIVLVDDDFSSLVKSIRVGRRIFDNLRKAMAYVIAVHVPIAGLSLVPVLLGHPLIFFPVHIVFWELIIDPACSIVFEAEPEEDDIMQRKPRDPSRSLFSTSLVTLGLLQGITVLLISVGVYLYSLASGHTTSETRTLTFITIIAGNLSLILANRSWSTTILRSMMRPNAALWWILSGATFFLILITHVSFLKRLFLFETPDELHMLASFSAGLGSVIVFEIIKIFFRKNLQ